jgi:hypothetical protein
MKKEEKGGEDTMVEDAKELVKFDCAICGVEWTSKVKRAGERLCETCVELRRALNSFINRGLELETLKERTEKILTKLG